MSLKRFHFTGLFFPIIALLVGVDGRLHAQEQGAFAPVVHASPSREIFSTWGTGYGADPHHALSRQSYLVSVPYPPTSSLSASLSAPAATEPGRAWQGNHQENPRIASAAPITPDQPPRVETKTSFSWGSFEDAYRKAVESTKKATSTSKEWVTQNWNAMKESVFKSSAADALQEEDDFDIGDDRKEIGRYDQQLSALFARAVEFEKTGLLEEAKQGYSDYLQAARKLRGRRLGIDYVNAYHRLAVVYWKQGETAMAESWFRYAVNASRHRANTALATDYALFLEERRDYRQSEIILKNALIAAPENHRAIRLLGRSIAFQGRPHEALHYLKPSIGEESAYRELASIYREQGNEIYALAMEERSGALRDSVRNLAGITAPRSVQSSGFAPPKPETPLDAQNRLHDSQPVSAATGGMTNHAIPSTNGTPWLPVSVPSEQNPASPPAVPGVYPFPKLTTLEQTNAERTETTNAQDISKLYHYAGATVAPGYLYTLPQDRSFTQNTPVHRELVYPAVSESPATVPVNYYQSAFPATNPATPIYQSPW